MDVGDIIRPIYEEFAGVEDLIVNYTKAGSVKLIRLKSNEGFKEENNKTFTISEESAKNNSIFIRKATKAEMILYGIKDEI